MGNISDKNSAWADVSFLVGLPLAVRAALLLNVPKIIDAAYPTLALSAQEICKQVPTDGENLPASADNLERILDWLCCNGVFSVTVEEGEGSSKLKKYAHSPKSRCLSQDQTANWVLFFTAPELTKVWAPANEIVLRPNSTPSQVVLGKGMYEYLAEDAREAQRLYVRGLDGTAAQALKLLENLDEHFKTLRGRVVDVGGQEGTMCAALAAKYRHLQFVNFDLPAVVKAAPEIAGVQHVGGSHLDSVPQGHLLFMKFCLLNWDDEACVRILTNCRKALPASQGGKLLIVDPLDRSTEASDAPSEVARIGSTWLNLQTPLLISGARRRTVEQIQRLVLAAGFSEFRLVEHCPGYEFMEASLLPTVQTLLL
ncbi:hypothetical protein Mapa_015114 [Marchantia paleacea]|nr:hypothetical protein Mapa_015114 [Marchantia paleacea]